MSDPLAAFLKPLGLIDYLQTFKDEEINDVSLLKSMGEEMLRESMEELGMSTPHIDKLAKAVFGGGKAADDDDDGLALEENADDDEPLALEENDLSLEDNAAVAPPPAPAAPTVSDASKKAAERVKAQGNDALKQGKFAEAASLYGQAIGLDPTNSVYYSNRSSALCSLSKFDKALADAEKCVALKPEWAKGHLRLAGAYAGLKRHEAARDAFAAALKCEPGNAQIKQLLEAATETVEAEVELSNDVFDWMQELNDRVPPNPFYEKGLELQDDAPMTIDYRDELQSALEALAEEEGKAVIRTPKGAGMLVEKIIGTNFEKIVLVCKRAGGQLKGLSKHAAVKLWHMKKDWRDEGDDEDAIAERMARRSNAEHTRLRQLAGCKHWLQLVADVAAEKVAVIGGERYPAIYLEHFPGKDVTEILSAERPPNAQGGGGGGGAAKKQKKGGNNDDSDNSDDDDDDDGNPRVEEVDEEAVERWAASKRAYTPGKLWEELTVIKTVALGVLRGMKEANEAGFRFEPDGSEGPFLGDVLLLDGKVKLVDTEPLGEFDEGEDRFFTAEPLVYSPLGEFFRSWWVGCADKIGMSIDGTKQCPDPKFQEVLNSFGTLNWLLFKWEREKLAGDEIIHMLVHGPQAAAEARPDPSVEAHWEDFMNRAFVMLGPRRFDEIKAINELMQRNEITPEDIVARSRYCFGRDFENMHAEYLKILKKLGMKF